MICAHYFVPNGKLPDGRYKVLCKKCNLHFWNEHKQVTVKPGLTVDEKMAPLLKALWRMDIRTEYSCQGDAKRKMGSYIKFHSVGDLDYFCRIIMCKAGFRPVLDRGRYLRARPNKPIVAMIGESIYFDPYDLPKFTKLFKRLAK